MSASNKDNQDITVPSQILTPAQENYTFWHSQGIVLMKRKRYREAIESYDKALNLEPSHYPTWHHRGTALRKIGNFDEAIASYEQAVNLRPNYPQAWNYRGVALIAWADKKKR